MTGAPRFRRKRLARRVAALYLLTVVGVYIFVAVTFIQQDPDEGANLAPVLLYAVTAPVSVVFVPVLILIADAPTAVGAVAFLGAPAVAGAAQAFGLYFALRGRRLD